MQCCWVICNIWLRIFFNNMWLMTKSSPPSIQSIYACSIRWVLLIDHHFKPFLELFISEHHQPTSKNKYPPFLAVSPEVDGCATTAPKTRLDAKTPFSSWFDSSTGGGTVGTVFSDLKFCKYKLKKDPKTYFAKPKTAVILNRNLGLDFLLFDFHLIILNATILTF